MSQSCWHRGPLGQLIIPSELRSVEIPDTLLIIELADRPEVTIDVLTEMLKATTALYHALSEIYGQLEAPSLKLVQVESGTNVTLSFTGVADVVVAFKQLFIEMWNTYRYKKEDEIINKNRAVASSIDVLAKIESQEKKHSLGMEDAARLKHLVISNTLTLFKEGVLVSNIPPTEIVDNRKLLFDGFVSPKLLTAPEHPTEVFKKVARKKVSRKKSPTTPIKT